MSVEGVDYSFARPGGAALFAAGKRFAMRYVPYPGAGAKGLDRIELDDLHKHGIAVGLVFESTATRALSGRAAGVVDATYVLNGSPTTPSVKGLGFPDATPIYFGVDFNATVAQQAAIDAYLGGAAAVLGAARVGVYGGYNTVAHCFASRSAKWFWQTYAWSAGRVFAHAHLLQYLNGQNINGSVDLCRGLQPDFGQWLVGLPPSDTAGVDMIHVKGQAPIGTFKLNGAGHSLLDVTDPKGTRYPRAADEVFDVLAGPLGLVDATGKPIDIDGRQPPAAGRDKVYLVDETAFGAAAFALAMDGTYSPKAAPQPAPDPGLAARKAAAVAAVEAI